MSYPPPPGLNASQSSPSGSSLPPRPPPSTAAGVGRGSGSYGAAMAFAPRAVAASRGASSTNNSSSVVSAPPSSYSNNSNAAGPSIGPSAPYYTQQPQAAMPASSSYYAQPTTADATYNAYAAPQIRNPFAPPSANPAGRGAFPAYDPEMEAQIAQWQSAYGSGGAGGGSGGASQRSAGTNANLTPLGGGGALNNADVASAAAGAANSGVAAVVTGADGKRKTVVRSGGGQTWQDQSLLEWDPSHFRIFVGNLAGEVTDDSLLKAFAKFPSVQRARVVRDKRTTKSKGYGFVSFSDGDDYFQAAREMQGKYIGSHPVLIKKSTTDIKAVTPRDNAKGKKGGRGGASAAHTGHGAGTGAGVQKKQSKTKGGLKILG